MTDREMLNVLLAHLGHDVYTNESQYVEIENGAMGECIAFEFDENGNILNIFS